MKTIQALLSVMFIGFIAAASCEREEELSDIPEIHFKSLNGPYLEDIGGIVRYSADLTFTFADGDSDIGDFTSAGSTDTINLVLLPYQKIDGVYESVDSALYGHRFTVRHHKKLDRDGAAIKGEITVAFGYIIKPPFDTLRYEFYLYDRARHKSNVETTSDISF